MFCDTHGCRRFIPSSQRCKTCLRGRGTDLKSAQAFGQHENNSTSSDGLMDACLYGDVAQWLERGKLINLRGRRFESFHLHDYIAITYSSKTRSSNIWKVGLLWHHGRVWFIETILKIVEGKTSARSNRVHGAKFILVWSIKIYGQKLGGQYV